MKHSPVLSKKTNNRSTGALGEGVAAYFLEKKGFSVIVRNFKRTFAEIDIICKKNNTIHFVEVKTVSYETRVSLEYAVAHETWRPEEQVHAHKLKQISKGVEAWIQENRYTGNFQIDVVTVRIVPHETYARVKFIQNVIID